jgi:hypothetical protein
MDNEKKEVTRELFLEFERNLLNKYVTFCQKEGTTIDIYNLIDFLFQINIIKDVTVAKFMVMELYPAALFENESKMNAIMDISIQTGLSEKTVYNMIQHPESFGYGISKKRNKKNYNK